jgi:DNA polymerase
MPAPATELTNGHEVSMTELENPNSVQQMKQWLSDNGLETDSLGKEDRGRAYQDSASRNLQTRSGCSGSSLPSPASKNIRPWNNAVCADGRARGMFHVLRSQPYRSLGRTALFNYKTCRKTIWTDLAEARSLVRYGDFDDGVEMLLYEDVPDTLIAAYQNSFYSEGRKRSFIVSDFSAIEARVIAWYGR